MAPITNTQTCAVACGCSTTYGPGQRGQHNIISSTKCEKHALCYARYSSPAPATEEWEELFLATYPEISRSWPL